VLAACAVAAEPARTPERLTVRVLGLFSPARLAVLRAAFAELPELKLRALDFAEAEMTVEFVPGKAFPGAKPEQFVPRLNERIRHLTHHTLGVAPRFDVPRDKLTVLVIPVAGCDCPGCNLAAVEAIDKLEGVERVTCSFKDGKLTARIDPSKVSREALEEALKNRHVTVLPAQSAP
jgi:copper chaperone CopZ